MFNNTKNKTSKKMTHEPTSGQPVINIISEGTEIEGKITTQNDFRVSGKVNGEIFVKGKCIVTKSGFVTGDLRAYDADISGKTNGNLIVGNKLYLRQTAEVSGDIHTKTLLIEEGAVFKGVCRMSNDPLSEKGENEKKKLDKPSAKNGNGQKEYKPGFELDQAKS
jgi:cytoskeletal protein CcmA (bactofilin family)